MFETAAAHWTQWIAQKSRKNSFKDRTNRSSYEPKNNTEGLNDGSAQARAILGPTFEGDITEEGAGIRRHALDYLKGKDVNNLGMWTTDFFEVDEDGVSPLAGVLACGGDDEDVPPTA